MKFLLLLLVLVTSTTFADTTVWVNPIKAFFPQVDVSISHGIHENVGVDFFINRRFAIVQTDMEMLRTGIRSEDVTENDVYGFKMNYYFSGHNKTSWYEGPILALDSVKFTYKTTTTKLYNLGYGGTLGGQFIIYKNLMGRFETAYYTSNLKERITTKDGTYKPTYSSYTDVYLSIDIGLKF